MQGVCTQRHFPAVAQPFRILWAPWSLAVVGVATSFITAGFLMVTLGMSVGGVALAFLLPFNQVMAIVFGLKLRYIASIVTSVDNRKTGRSNLSEDKAGFEFANI